MSRREATKKPRDTKKQAKSDLTPAQHMAKVRKHHGPRTGHNGNHVVVRGEAPQATSPVTVKAEILVASLDGSHKEPVKISHETIPGISVSEATQQALFGKQLELLTAAEGSELISMEVQTA
jgi:hypothetical protein